MFSQAFNFNLTDLWKTVRTALILGACLGGVEAIEQINQFDFGAFDKIIGAGAAVLVDALRRWMRDNTVAVPVVATTPDGK